MAQPIDSLSITLTADTSSAEESINKLIGRLALLKVAVQGASNFAKIAAGIKRIADAAKQIDTDSGKKLSDLARGLSDLSKVGDLSNLADAGKNVASIIRAVGSISGKAGDGLDDLAHGIGRTRDALNGLNDANTSKLEAIRDTLSGEMSGSLHTANEAIIERPALGGSVAQNYDLGLINPAAVSIYDRIAYAINEATAAHRAFRAEVGSGGGIAGLLGKGPAGGAMTVFKYTADSIRDATAAYREFKAALGSGVPPIFTNFADDAARTGGSVRMLTGSIGGQQQAPLEADEIRDAARAYDDLGNSASRAADVIETEFVNPFANFKMKPLEDELPKVTLNPIDGSVADSANNAASAFGGLAGALGGLSGVLGPVASGLGAVGKAMFAIPKYFGGQLIGNIQKATKGLTGFFNSIVRIAKYRLIRTALKLITQGINEGIKNLYSWSQTADTTFYNSMNQIATATKYMGNSFAAMAAPLVNALAPAIDFIIDKFVELFNFINQVIARISGQTTYTAAKKVAATWDDTTKKAGKSAADTAKKTTDEIKRTILGFDEINKLNGDTDAGSSSGGSGSGSGSGTSASSMFETRTIDGSVSSFADSLKAAFDRSDWQGLGELLGGKVNELVDKIDFAGAGQKVGYYINAWFSTKYWTLDTINFTNIGSKIAEFLNNAIKEIHFDIIGASLVQKLTIIGDLIIGFFTDFDRGQAATSFSDFVKGIFNEISKWLDKYDWGDVGNTIYTKLKDALTNLDLNGIATSFVTALGKAIKAVVSAGAGFLAGFWADVTAYWEEHIKADDFTTTVHNILDAIGQGFSNLGEWVWTSIIKPFGAALTGNENWDTELLEVGKNIIEGIFKGISNVISGIGDWIKTNIFDPFLKWFKNVFGIASPAKTMEEPGENIIKGVLQGIINGLKNIGQWVKDNIFTPIWKAIKNVGAIVLEIGAKIITTAQSLWDGLKSGWNKVTGKIVEFAANLKNDAAAWWKNAQDWWSSKVGAVKNFFTNLADNSSAWWKNAQDWWSSKVGAVKNFFTNLADNSSAWWKNAQDWWSSKVGAVKNFFTNLADNSSAWWKNAQDWWSSKVGAVKNFFTNLTDNSSAWWKNAQDWWSSKVGAVKDFWVKVKDDSATWWKNVQDWWSEAVSGKSVGITAKIVTLMATLWNSLRDRWDRFVSGKWLGINLRLGESSDPYYESGGIYTQEWYDKNIKPIQNNLNNNPLDIDVNANPGSGFSGGGKAGSVGAGRSFKLEKVEDSTVKVNAVYNSGGSLLSSIFNKIGTWLFGKDSTPSQDVIIKLVREAAWKDGLDKWLGTDVAHNAKIALAKSGWTTLDAFVGTSVTVSINLSSGNFRDGFVKWLTGNYWGNIDSSVNLSAGNFSRGFTYWVTGNYWGDINSDVYLKAGNFSNGYKYWLSGNYWGDVTTTVYLQQGWYGSLSDWIGSSVTVTVNLAKGGGVVNSNGYSASFAEGGTISNGVARKFSKIPRYAGGTADAHGTLFLAGEAGPEIVGHVGGRTEILNQSQLAQTMFAAVRNAMSGVRIGGHIDNAVSGGGSEADYEAMYRAMYDAFTDAMAGSNERDKEKVQLMRQIAAKEFTSEPTAAGMNRAQMRANRRAGTTIIPVGT